jgi:hypothetical protein
MLSKSIQHDFGIFKSPLHSTSHVGSSEADWIHNTCLTMQLLTLGFAFYARAHVGLFHPFFLDTALHGVNL